MQLIFDFLKENMLRWKDLDENARTEIVEKLARLIEKAAFPNQETEESEDE